MKPEDFRAAMIECGGDPDVVDTLTALLWPLEALLVAEPNTGFVVHDGDFMQPESIVWEDTPWNTKVNKVGRSRWREPSNVQVVVFKNAQGWVCSFGSEKDNPVECFECGQEDGFTALVYETEAEAYAAAKTMIVALRQVVRSQK